MNQKTTFELSVDTQLLYRHLVEHEATEVPITYEELSELIGRDVQREARHLLQSARRRALKRDRIVFGTVTGVGLRRLSDEEVAATGESFLKRIRRTARRASETVTCVQDFEKLPADAKAKHNATLSLAGVLRHFTQPRRVLQLEEKVLDSSHALPTAETIKLLE